MDKLSWFGITGALLVMLAVAYSAGVYRGRQGESFSLLNHFISELGEVGVSPGARIFNTTLIVGGLLFLPFIFGLGMALGSLLGGLGTLAGLVAGLALAAVGIFPMNDSENHSRSGRTSHYRSCGGPQLRSPLFLFVPEECVQATGRDGLRRDRQHSHYGQGL